MIIVYKIWWNTFKRYLFLIHFYLHYITIHNFLWLIRRHQKPQKRKKKKKEKDPYKTAPPPPPPHRRESLQAKKKKKIFFTGFNVSQLYSQFYSVQFHNKQFHTDLSMSSMAEKKGFLAQKCELLGNRILLQLFFSSGKVASIFHGKNYVLKTTHTHKTAHKFGKTLHWAKYLK